MDLLFNFHKEKVYYPVINLGIVHSDVKTIESYDVTASGPILMYIFHDLGWNGDKLLSVTLGYGSGGAGEDELISFTNSSTVINIS